MYQIDPRILDIDDCSWRARNRWRASTAHIAKSQLLNNRVDLETLIHQVLLTVRRAQRLFTAARYGTAVGTVRRLESPVNSAEESVIYSHVS